MDDGTREMAEALAFVAAIALAWGKAFGPYQVKLSNIVIEWFGVPTHQKGGINLAVGVVLALAFTTGLAWYTGNYRILPFSVMAGVVAAVDASQMHDAAKSQNVDQVNQAFYDGQEAERQRVLHRRSSIRNRPEP